MSSASDKAAGGPAWAKPFSMPAKPPTAKSKSPGNSAKAAAPTAPALAAETLDEPKPKPKPKRFVGPSRGPLQREPADDDAQPEPPATEVNAAGEATDTATEADAGPAAASTAPPPSEAAPPSSEAAAAASGENRPTDLKGNVAQASDQFPQLPYNPPSWAAELKPAYRLEVLKNGSVVESINLQGKSQIVVGRLPNCDIVMEHQSCSRYHCVLQCGDDGHVYVYDLGSTHGTKINKGAAQARKYFRLRLGHMVRFGASSRLYLLQASEESMESEQVRLEELEVKVKDKAKIAAEAKVKAEAAAAAKQASGVSWGMDAEPEEDPEDGPGEPGVNLGPASGDNSAYYLEDPKKALRTYFERESASLDYETEQDGPGHARVYTCRIRLPVEGDDGEPLIAEASIQGKRKEAIQECALIACKMLDAKGVLRNDEAKATRKAKRKAMKEKEDSDDDTFYDRTGEVEAKRKRKAMRKAALVSETYESLCAKKITATAELREIQQKLSDAKKKVQEIQHNSGLDPLDAFVSGLTNNLGDETMARMKRRQRELQIELNEYEKLLTLVTPAIKI